MNLILFDPHELGQPLPRADRRATHILNVLRRKPGDTVDVGVINGARGKATILTISEESLTFGIALDGTPAAAEPVTLIIGMPRPQTARDILRDATTLGVAAIHFVGTQKAERSYAASTLWGSGEWRRHVVSGAEQAFDTRIPEVEWRRTLGETLPLIPPGSARIALDNYEAPERLSEAAVSPEQPHVVLAIGGERGWSARERDLLRSHRFTLACLGSRVLRTEAAVIAALTIVRSKLGLM